jgi:hypothetical protein
MIDQMRVMEALWTSLEGSPERRARFLSQS